MKTNKQKTRELKNEKTEKFVENEQEVKVDEKQNEIDSLKNQLARTLADYQNQNKRFQEERAQIFAYSSQKVLENLIPVLDILEKSQEHVQDQGLGMAISEFKRVLKEEGLEEIVPSVHNPFDHEVMEAVESVEGEGEKGAVFETVLSGWKFKEGKIVRYAKVKVFGGN
jgi:molecular chaperone GrpE